MMTPEQQELEVRASVRDMAVQAELRKQKKVAMPLDEDIIAMSGPTGRTSLRKYNDYVTWWTGGDTSGGGFTDVRLDFLRREVLYAARRNNSEQIMMASSEGRLTHSEATELSTSVIDWNDKLPTELQMEQDVYCRFRLWYTGQRVQKIPNRHHVEEEEEDEGEEEFTEEQIAAFRVKQVERLNQRSSLLRERIERVDERKQVATILLQKHKKATEKGLVADDLENRLFDLSDDDLDCLMPSVLVIQLALAAELDASKLFSLPVLPSQRISGEDLFVPQPDEHLVPENPPVMTPMCLPGTSRRPLKPWFRCERAEQLMEVKMALALDSIVELAVIDGMPIPDIEDITVIFI